MPPAAVRVLIAEDNAIFVEGLQVILGDDPAIEVVGVEGDRDAALAAAVSLRPDVVLTDLRMPPTFTDEGLQIAHAVAAKVPGTGVILLSQHADLRVARELLEGYDGSRGYLLKDNAGTRDLLTAAVRSVAAGGMAVDPSLVEGLLHAARGMGDGSLQGLTSRELDALRLMAEGLNNEAIAERLNLTVATVEKRLTSLFRKLPIGEDRENKRVSAVLIYLAAMRGGDTTP